MALVAVDLKQIENAEKQKHLSLLLVDDDVELCGMMREFFTQEGHHLDCAYNGRDGLSAALNGAYDMVILDVMLPVVDGFELLQRLRKRKDLPIIMLTARVQQQDRIRGLDSGADDYLPKPFDPDELLARVRAVLRRIRVADADGFGKHCDRQRSRESDDARGMAGRRVGGVDFDRVRSAGDADARGRPGGFAG